jgi:hypothetical protein
MSHGWWSLDRGVVRRRAARGVLGFRPGALRHQLGADHGDFAGRLDAQPHLAAVEADHGHANVLADEEFFHQLPG